jgi:hypothetical protein
MLPSGAGLAHKYLTELKRFARNKRSSLFAKSIIFCISTFFFVNDAPGFKAGAFVLGKSFHTGLKFTNKVRAYPSEVSSRYSPLG